MIWVVIGFIIFILNWKIVHILEFDSTSYFGKWEKLKYPVWLWIIFFIVSFIPILGICAFVGQIIMILLEILLEDMRIIKSDPIGRNLTYIYEKYLKFLFKKI